MSSAEEIRLKRLARLGGGGSSSPRPASPASGAGTTDSGQSASAASAASASAASAPGPAAASKSDSDKTSAAKPPAANRPKVKIVPKAAPAASAASASAAKPAAKPAPAPAATATQPFADYEQETIERVLKISVRNSPSCAQLESVKQELQEDDKPVLLTESVLDSALFAHLSAAKNVFTYLMNSHLRAKKELAVLNKAATSSSVTDFEPKKALLKTILEISTRYAQLALSVPDMYENGRGVAELLELSQRGSLSWEFMEEIFQRAVSDSEMGSLASKLLLDVNTLVLGLDPSQSSTASLYFVSHLFGCKPFAAAVPEIENFVESGFSETAAQIEKNPTSLGPIFSISPLHGSTALTFYPVGTPEAQMDPRGNASNGVRSEMRIVQDQLFQICDKIVRASPAARDCLLRYFGRVLSCNHRRRATRLQEGSTSSDGFLMNITFVLLKLADPFVDAGCSKIDRIDMDYFRKEGAAVDISEETKLHADSTESTEYYGSPTGPAPNFISQIFFLTAGYLHYGFGGAQQQVTRLKENVDQGQAYLVNARAQFEMVPQAQREHSRGQLEKVEKLVASFAAQRAAILAVVSDQDVCIQVLQFATFQMDWLVRVLDPSHKHPHPEVTLPLDLVKGSALEYLPEYFVEGPVGIINTMCRHQTILVMLSPLVNTKTFVTFGVVFLRHSEVIKNPHLKSKIVEMLFCGTSRIYTANDGFLVNIFNMEKIALDNLMHSLMNIYIEFEQTGAHTQFYDKFNIRYYVSQIIEAIWNNVHYQKRLEKESHDNIDFFVRFVALLLNDVTYLMDESLSALSEIKQVEAELAAMGPAESQSPRAKELESKYKAAERNVKGYMPLTNKNMKLLDLFTQAVPLSFVSPEIVDRLAAMMNHNLKALVGPKCADLKVKNSLKYNFDPKDLLVKLMKAYLNLRKESSFVEAVARDGRSFDPANFSRAIDHISRLNLMPREFINSIAALRDEASKVALRDEEDEQDLGEIPEEYLDPLMYTLMKNPVLLPSSKINIDLATIKSHLLSDPKDPFNRAPLKLDEVVPNKELKNEIEEWVKSKKLAAKSRDGDGDVSME